MQYVTSGIISLIAWCSKDVKDALTCSGKTRDLHSMLFLYNIAMPPPLLPLSVLCKLKPLSLIIFVVTPELSCNHVSVRNAMSTPSNACITLSVLLQIERTFHNIQEIRFIVLGRESSFFPGNMVYYLLIFSVQVYMLDNWVMMQCDLGVVSLLLSYN